MNKQSEVRSEVKREVLAEGLIVSIPADKERRECETPDGTKYLHCAFPIMGGVVNTHLFGEPKQVGGRFWVKATIVRKHVTDNRSFVYVDYHPTDATTLTHELKFYQKPVQVPTEYRQQDLTLHGHVVKPGQETGGVMAVPIGLLKRQAA